MDAEATSSKSPEKGFRSWSVAGTVALVTSLLAVVVPATTAINGYFQTQIKKQELDHKIMLEWIDRAVDEKKSTEYRKELLNILRIVFREQPLEEWVVSYQASVAAVSRDFQEQRKQASTVVVKLDQVQLNRLAEGLGIPKGTDTLLLLTALAYNIRRAITLVGVPALIDAARA